MDPRPHGLRLPLAGDDFPPVQHRHHPTDVPQTCHPRHTGTPTIDINHQEKAVQSGSPFNLNPLFSAKSPAFSKDTNVQKLRPGDSAQYLLPWLPADQDNFPDEAQRAKIGSRSPITRYWVMSFTVLPNEKKG